MCANDGQSQGLFPRPRGKDWTHGGSRAWRRVCLSTDGQWVSAPSLWLLFTKHQAHGRPCAKRFMCSPSFQPPTALSSQARKLNLTGQGGEGPQITQALAAIAREPVPCASGEHRQAWYCWGRAQGTEEAPTGTCALSRSRSQGCRLSYECLAARPNENCPVIQGLKE